MRHELYRKRLFRNAVEREIAQAERDRISGFAGPLRDLLTRSLLELEELVSDQESRFYEVLGRVAASAELIEISPRIVGEATNGEFFEDDADNLIACCILDHARAHPSEAKGFLSGNTDDFGEGPSRRRSRDAGRQKFRAALRGVGVERYFTNAADARGWLSSRNSP
jgi:hypothetical protein